LDYPYSKFGDCSFSRFGSVVRGQTDTYKDRRRWTLYFRDSRRRE